MPTLKILVTGGAGFIGSEFVRQLANNYGTLSVKAIDAQQHKKVSRYLKTPRIAVIDKLTYAGDLKRLAEVKGKFKFYKADICDKIKIDAIFRNEKPGILVHFAAESHVDRSIVDPSSFIATNINGAKVLLDACLKYKVKKLIHISTDEVYGEIEKGVFQEDSPLRPNSPYSASKAAADLLIKSYIRTYNFPAIIIRPSNNYGPWQYPEKFIPVIINSVLRNKKIPVYAKGLNVREWLYLSDCIEGVLLIMRKGRIGETYNIGSGVRVRNIDLVKKILTSLAKPYSFISFVKDRPGHDLRYSLNSSKIRKLGWRPSIDLDTGLRKTIDWYKQNISWLKSKS